MKTALIHSDEWRRDLQAAAQIQVCTGIELDAIAGLETEGVDARDA